MVSKRGQKREERERRGRKGESLLKTTEDLAVIYIENLNLREFEGEI